MICEACKHENEAGVKFCSKCGEKTGATPAPGTIEVVPEADAAPAVKPEEALVATSAPEAKPSTPAAPASSSLASTVESIKQMPPKKLAIFGGGIAAVIILLIIIIAAASGGSRFDMRQNSITFLREGSEIIVLGNNNRFTIDGRYNSSQVSMDGSRAAVLTDWSSANGGTLWFVTTSRATLVAEDVFSFTLSNTGRGIIFYTDRIGGDWRTTLNLYETNNSRLTRISEDAHFEASTISPDGRTVAFVVAHDARGNEITGYMRVNNRNPERLGDNILPIAVSNGGRHLYYIREDETGRESFHVRSGRNSNRLIPEIGRTPPTIMFNNDYSQIMFTMDGRTFFSRNGSERERVSALEIQGLLVPPNTQVNLRHGFIQTYGVSTFANQVALSVDSNWETRLEVIDRRFEASMISGTAGLRDAHISENGRTLLFVNRSGHLMSVDPTNNNPEATEIARNLRFFVASSDASHVYFINSDNELMHVRGNRTPTRIADFASHLVMSPRGNRAFFITDMGRNGGDLQTSNNGGRPSRVATEVMSVTATPTSVLYRNFDSDVYRSNGNANFSRVAADAIANW